MNTTLRHLRLIAVTTIAAAVVSACGGGGGGGSTSVSAGAPAPSPTPTPTPTPTPVPTPTPTPPPTPTPAPDPAGVPIQPPDQAPVPTWDFPTPAPNPTPTPTPTPTPAPTPTPTPTPTPPSTVLFGTVKFGLAAEPACGFDAVNVTVTKVRFHMSASAAASDPGWTEIALQPARRINLASMSNGALEALATAALAPGQYAQARLVLDPNSANDTTNSVVVAGAEVPLVTQSPAADGILIGATFDLANGQTLNLVVDFDACRSVVPSGGQYLLRPVVQAVQTVKNGITGFVATSLLGAHARVTAQQGGVVVRATVPDPVTGEFFLARLEAGSYDVVVTADGRAASVIASVPVASSVSTTALSTAANPLTLQASGMGRIDASLALIPSSTVQPAFGSAIQSFAAGPAVTINYRVADLGTGAIRFSNVPIASPLLATYAAGQPLAFNAQTVAPGAGVYTVAASAPGYVTTRTLPLPTTGN